MRPNDPEEKEKKQQTYLQTEIFHRRKFLQI